MNDTEKQETEWFGYEVPSSEPTWPEVLWGPVLTIVVTLLYCWAFFSL